MPPSRFMAMASVSWASEPRAPWLMAAVEKRRRIRSIGSICPKGMAGRVRRKSSRWRGARRIPLTSSAYLR